MLDALSYTIQTDEIKKRHREQRDLNRSEEFLSGITKSDKIAPVITLVVYLGEKPWDVSSELYEMMDVFPFLDDYKTWISNYRLNVLEIRNVENLEHYKSDLRELFGIYKYKHDGSELIKYVEKNKSRYSHLKEDTFDFIGVVMGMENDMKSFKKLINRQETGGFDMCKALEEILMMGEERGKSIGELQGIEIGENRFAQLSLLLLDSLRLEDLAHAASDKEYRFILFQEFGL